jgi:hypothetical protein
MMAVAVYLLCSLTSGACALQLFRMYRRSGMRLLFWSALSFLGWALSNALVFADFVIVPNVDLSILRSTTACGAVCLLLYGLIWDRP